MCSQQYQNKEEVFQPHYGKDHGRQTLDQGGLNIDICVLHQDIRVVSVNISGKNDPAVACVAYFLFIITWIWGASYQYKLFISFYLFESPYEKVYSLIGMNLPTKRKYSSFLRPSFSSMAPDLTGSFTPSHKE
jgi:hypothetical protein